MLTRGIRRDSHSRTVVARTRPHDGSAAALPAVFGPGPAAARSAAAWLAAMSGRRMLTRGIRLDSHSRTVVARTWPQDGLAVTSGGNAGMHAGSARPPGAALPDGPSQRPDSPIVLPSPRASRLSGTAEHMSPTAINRYERLRPMHYDAWPGALAPRPAAQPHGRQEDHPVRHNIISRRRFAAARRGCGAG